jgi:SAM-dependent methyltransferase
VETGLYAQIRSIEADHWWYVGRRRIVFDWLAPMAAGYTAPRILDIGCGTGMNLQVLRDLGCRRTVGLDIAPEALAYCQGRHVGPLVQADGARLPFAPSSFDIVMALDLIEHVEDDVSALLEIARLLRPGGRLLIFTPAYQFLWSHQDEVSHHFRRYTATLLRDRLVQAGFRVEKLTYANTLLFPLVWFGRLSLRLRGRPDAVSENDMHPSWANGALASIFSAERRALRHVNLPFGVSLLSVAIRS